MLASFAEFGFVQGNWNARIPSVKNALGVGLDTLGFLLLPVGVGALVAMSATGWILRRWSSTRLRRVACVASCAALLAAAWTTVHWQLAVLLAVVGAGWGAWDVTINVQGATVERRTGGVLLPAMHGAWGVGLLAGALTGSAFAAAGVAVNVQVAGVVAATLVADARLVRGIPTIAPPVEVARPSARPPVARILLLGIAMSCATLAEGAASDWLALHVTEDLGGTTALGGQVFAALALLLTFGRFTCHLAIERLGRVAVVRWSGVLLAAGMLLTAIAPGGATVVALGAPEAR